MRTEKNKVLAFMITRADTPQRIELCKQTVENALKTAGMEFGLHIHSWSPGLNKDSFPKKNVYWHGWDHNVGQHVITNYMLKWAKDNGYEHLLRLDDDCQFLTKRWLVKLMDAAEKLGPTFIIAPTVQGLKHPPDRSETVEVEGVEVKLLCDAIGGVCRLHNVANLTDPEYPYIADVRWPLGFGDATGIAMWCKKSPQDARRWMVYLDRVRVKHSTKKQEEEDKVYHEQHDMYQHLPYIPPYAPPEDEYR